MVGRSSYSLLTVLYITLSTLDSLGFFFSPAQLQYPMPEDLGKFIMKSLMRKIKKRFEFLTKTTNSLERWSKVGTVSGLRLRSAFRVLYVGKMSVPRIVTKNMRIGN